MTTLCIQRKDKPTNFIHPKNSRRKWAINSLVRGELKSPLYSLLNPIYSSLVLVLLAVSTVFLQLAFKYHWGDVIVHLLHKQPPERLITPVIFDCKIDLEPAVILAQALKQHDIPFTVYERDPSVSARGRGWGLTIHWSLEAFVSLLPQHLVDKLPEAFVNPSATEKGENGNFLFFDLRSGEARWKVPPSKRIRVSRERLRALLLEGLDVQVIKLVPGLSCWHI